MGRGLVGDDIEVLAAGRPGRLDLGGVADQGDRQRLAGRRGGPGHPERLVRVVGEAIDVADLEAPLRPRLVDLDAQRHPVVHRHGQRLGAAHPAEAGGEGDPAPQRAAEMLAGQLGERLERALQDPLGADVDPRARRSSGRTSSGPPARARGRPPRWPICRRGSSWRSGPAAPTRGCGRRRRACPTGRGGSRRRPAGEARGRSRRRRPRNGRRGRCRRRRRARRGSRRPPDRGCS